MIPEYLRSYEAWEKTVPEAISQEDVWKFMPYPKALFLYDLCWYDCEKLMKDLRGRKIAGQLISSVGSVSANMEEGYGRGLKTREYHQFLRYAIGSGKEAKGWYFRSKHILPGEVIIYRLNVLNEIMALTITQLKKQKQRKGSR